MSDDHDIYLENGFEFFIDDNEVTLHHYCDSEPRNINLDKYELKKLIDALQSIYEKLDLK